MSEDSLRAATVAKNNSSIAIEAPKNGRRVEFVPADRHCLHLDAGAPPVSTEVAMLDNTD